MIRRDFKHLRRNTKHLIFKYVSKDLSFITFIRQRITDSDLGVVSNSREDSHIVVLTHIFFLPHADRLQQLLLLLQPGVEKGRANEYSNLA